MRFEHFEGVQVVAATANGMANQLALRFDHPLLQDIRVRQAIIHGVNREEIIRILLSDSYPLATSSMTSKALGYAEQPGDHLDVPQTRPTRSEHLSRRRQPRR